MKKSTIRNPLNPNPDFWRPVRPTRGTPLTVTFTKEEKAILADPSASYWLKEQIRSSYNRDICYACADAEAFLDILQKRFNRMTSGPRLTNLDNTQDAQDVYELRQKTHQLNRANLHCKMIGFGL
jgi:hypothetical protein